MPQKQIVFILKSKLVRCEKTPNEVWENTQFHGTMTPWKRQDPDIPLLAPFGVQNPSFVSSGIATSEALFSSMPVSLSLLLHLFGFSRCLCFLHLYLLHWNSVLAAKDNFWSCFLKPNLKYIIFGVSLKTS